MAKKIDFAFYDKMHAMYDGKVDDQITPPTAALQAQIKAMINEEAAKYPNVTVKIVHWYSGYIFNIEPNPATNTLYIFIGSTIVYDPASFKRSWNKVAAEFVGELRTKLQKAAGVTNFKVTPRKTEIEAKLQNIVRTYGMSVKVNWKDTRATIYSMRTAGTKLTVNIGLMMVENDAMYDKYSKQLFNEVESSLMRRRDNTGMLR